MKRARSFLLLWYYLGVIAFALPSVTGITAWWTALTFRAELFDEAKQYATDVAQNVYHRIEKDFLLPCIERGEYIDLLNNTAQRARVREIVRDCTFRHRVKELYFFNTDGTITFSTVEEHIGAAMPPGNVHFEAALGDEVSSVVRQRDNPLDISSTPRGIELLETYVPVHGRSQAAPAPIVGVVEVYQDMGRLQRAVHTSRLRLAAVALVSMGVLGGFFALITLKADRTIREREREILTSNVALQELSQGLERQVEERTRQLIQQEKLASLGTLAAGVAHEINNPLATISACAEGSLDRLKGVEATGEGLSAVERYLTLIRQEVFQCKKITRNLLEFSRQQRSSETEIFDLDELVHRSLELVQIASPAPDVDLQLDLHGPRQPLAGDPIQIRQIIHNLLANSFDAVRENEHPRVLLRTRATPEAAVLECWDNGPGVAAEDREKLFEPFFTTKASGEGTGLGLAVCYSIAQRHLGRLELVANAAAGTVGESRPEDDQLTTCFRLTLPRTGGGAEEPAAERGT